MSHLSNQLQTNRLQLRPFHKIFVAQKPITFSWWEECHAPFYP